MTTKNVAPARGFRDYPPALKRRRETLLTSIRAVYRQHGFIEIETPVVEPLERLRDSEGGENLGMIFEIQRRGLTEVDLRDAADPHQLCDLGMRYDLTVPLARFYATEHARLPRVARLVQIGPVWRAERPQKGRYRQFTQCDIDTIGESSTLAELELIIATLRALDAIGVRGAVVRLNDRRLLRALLESCGIHEDRQAAALIAIDKLDKIGLDGVEAQLEKLQIGAAASRLRNHLADFMSGPVDIDTFVRSVGASALLSDQVIVDHRSILDGVQSEADASAIRFDPSLVRGLGYYTGPIFEIEHPDSGKSVAGGGRYDGMIGRFLGRDVPACGFSLGFERLLEILGDRSDTNDVRVALLYESDASALAVTAEQRRLIDAGYEVTLMPRAKNMKRVFGEIREMDLTHYVQLGDADMRPVP